jgi:hypothetical protein
VLEKARKLPTGRTHGPAHIRPVNRIGAESPKGKNMVRSFLLLALALTGLMTPAKAQQPSFPLPPFLTPRGTPDDQRNCREDAVKFCREVVDNDDAVLRCFQANRAKLSPACQGVLEKYGR